MAFAYTKLMQAMVAAGVVSATDPYFNLVTLLLPGNGTNGAQNNTFLDSSTNNFSITRNGNTTQGTFSPFSQTGWGNFFNGSTDYLLGGNSTAYTLGTGDFSIEFFFYATSSGTTVGAMGTGGAEVGKTVQVFLTNDTKVNFNVYGGGALATGTGIWSANQWTHVVITRSSGNARIFVNGVLRAYGALTDNLVGADLSIGRSYFNLSQEYFPGYISNVRFIKGSIPTTYQTSSTTTGTSIFTSPTAALTTTSQGATGADVSILTCQSNRFVDNSTTSVKTVTPYGSTSVQAFSPFATTAAYSASTNGGSGYFDGNGDYLSLTGGVTDNGTGDLTLEFWSYYTGSYSAEAVAFDSRVSPFTNGFAITSAATSGYWTMNFASQDILTSTAAAKNAWQHVALTRSGNTFRLFVDGVLRGTLTSSNNLSNNTNKIGASYNNGGAWPGYIAGLRAIKGSIPTDYQTSSTTIGTSIFTPPTAPPTAVTNTSLLCNFTNAGITDATAKNVLETVGNAQISTTQSKFGGSSMYFDGTGDALNFRSNDILAFGTGDWTIEFWVYHASISGQQTYVGDTPGNSNGPYIYKDTSNKIGLYYSTQILTATNAISATTWYHVAIARASGTVRLFINGTQEASASDTTNLSVPVQWIGADGTSNYLNGYIDDLRITKGYARYTTTFTPPTAAFPLS